MLIHRADIHIVKNAHHFLGEPDGFVGIDRLDATLAAGGDKGEVFRRRGAGEGGGVLGLFFLMAAHGDEMECEQVPILSNSTGLQAAGRTIFPRPGKWSATAFVKPGCVMIRRR